VQFVHRLDLETSGLIVLAKTELANRELSARFRSHDLERVYLAVAAGAFPGERTSIDRPVGGRRAVTHVEVLERVGGLATVLSCRLETGRTHQIRLHLQATGYPVLGDPRYGGGKTSIPRPPRMALHATRLGFVHPRSGAELAFDSPWPSDVAAWLTELRGCATSPPL
jgi:23S rRNA pseudouridine1911/1915/1917 synthase